MGKIGWPEECQPFSWLNHAILIQKLCFSPCLHVIQVGHPGHNPIIEGLLPIILTMPPRIVTTHRIVLNIPGFRHDSRFQAIECVHVLLAIFPNHFYQMPVYQFRYDSINLIRVNHTIAASMIRLLGWMRMKLFNNLITQHQRHLILRNKIRHSISLLYIFFFTFDRWWKIGFNNVMISPPPAKGRNKAPYKNLKHISSPVSDIPFRLVQPAETRLPFPRVDYDRPDR